MIFQKSLRLLLELSRKNSLIWLLYFLLCLCNYIFYIVIIVCLPFLLFNGSETVLSNYCYRTNWILFETYFLYHIFRYFNFLFLFIRFLVVFIWFRFVQITFGCHLFFWERNVFYSCLNWEGFEDYF